MMQELWICGRLIGEWDPLGSKWSYQGVFSTERKAVKACRDKTYFIFPVGLDQELPHEIIESDPRARYPKWKKPRK